MPCEQQQFVLGQLKGAGKELGAAGAGPLASRPPPPSLPPPDHRAWTQTGAPWSGVVVACQLVGMRTLSMM